MDVGISEVPNISGSVSSGSFSPDLGDIWASGCPKSPSCCSHNDCESLSVDSDSIHEEGDIAETRMRNEKDGTSTWNMLGEKHWCQFHTI